MYKFYLTDVICFSVLVSFELWSRVSLFNLVFKYYLLMYFWLRRAFVALRRLSLVVVSRGCPSRGCWLLITGASLLWSAGSRAHGLQQLQRRL